MIEIMLHILTSVALVNQHSKRMRRIILSPVACPAVPYSPTVFHERHDFVQKKKVTEYKNVVF